ncbi:MAG: undecaprenyl/decaprenyl-phosphate alpha-N-acetylglucosaminyl 1-phosphate transferase [Planctomycetota bacterium]|nr:undecaprenyl/decaprenyl-phosphate alpha-N-acetylglucosaminyl 1-phosphate transferase [Planctomycetota bacterium]
MIQSWFDFVANNKTYAGCFLLGLLVAFTVTPLVIRLAFRAGVLDRPNHRKVHSKPMPLMGGLGIFVGMWVPLFLLSFHQNLVTDALEHEGWQQLASIFFAGLSMLVLGMVDDRLGLRARWKFLVQIPVAILLVWSGVRFENINLPFVGDVQLGMMGHVLSVVWLVGVTNALNLIDGIDGLAAGVAFFVAATNGIMALYNHHTLLAVVMCSLAGASLGFLRYNYNPARIFLGDTGSLCLGMTLAVTSVIASTKGSVATSMFVPVLVLGYPTLDTLVAMTRRLVTGKPVFSGDRAHLHHLLLAMGFDHKRASGFLYLVCCLFCVVGLSTVVGNDLAIGLGLAALGVLFAVGFRVLLAKGSATRDLLSGKPANMEEVVERFKANIEQANDREKVLELLDDVCSTTGVDNLHIEQQDEVFKEQELVKLERKKDAPSKLDRVISFVVLEPGMKVELAGQSRLLTHCEGNAIEQALQEIFGAAAGRLKALRTRLTPTTPDSLKSSHSQALGKPTSPPLNRPAQAVSPS